MANGAYNRFASRILGATNLLTATVRCMLVTSGYTFDADHDFVDDVTPGSNEITNTNYARQTLSSPVIELDDTNNRGEIVWNDPSFTNLAAGDTIAAAIFYEFITNDSDSPLICYVDSAGFPFAPNTNTFTVGINAEGLIQLST